MKLRKIVVWIAVVIGLVALLFVYPMIEHFLFGIQFCRKVRSELSKEKHEAFTSRMAQVHEGMDTGQVVRLIGVPTELAVSNGTQVMTYQWRGATEINRFHLMASGRDHTYRFVCCTGAVKTVEQSDGGWHQAALLR